jgi:hypothetical protein
MFFIKNLVLNGPFKDFNEFLICCLFESPNMTMIWISKSDSETFKNTFKKLFFGKHNHLKLCVEIEKSQLLLCGGKTNLMSDIL